MGRMLPLYLRHLQFLLHRIYTHTCVNHLFHLPAIHCLLRFPIPCCLFLRPAVRHHIPLVRPFRTLCRNTDTSSSGSYCQRLSHRHSRDIYILASLPWKSSSLNAPVDQIPQVLRPLSGSTLYGRHRLHICLHNSSSFQPIPDFRTFSFLVYDSPVAFTTHLALSTWKL